MHTQMREIRYSLGKTQREVAADLDVTQAAIYQWENKVVDRPRPHLAKALSDYYGVPITILLAPAENKTAPVKKTGAGE